MDGSTVLQIVIGGFTLFGCGSTVTWRIMSSKNNGKNNGNGKNHNHEQSNFILRNECERVHQSVDKNMSDLTKDVKDIQGKVHSIESEVKSNGTNIEDLKGSIRSIHSKIDKLVITKTI
jgi:peptidoglycan hydrolase CwlO-like protein